MARNMLTGTIPSDFSAISGLASLDLSNNYLTGTIPVLPAMMSVFTFIVPHAYTGERLVDHSCSPFSCGRALTLANNRLTGSLPASWTSSFKYVAL